MVEEIGISPDGNGGFVEVVSDIRERVCEDKSAWMKEVEERTGIRFDTVHAEQAADFSKEQDLQYYNEDIHNAAFVLPTYVRKMLEEA